MKKIIIGTRGSALALKQTEMVIAALGKNVETQVIIIKTSGDKDQKTPLAEIGGKELFTKEIDEALLRGEIDIAVHSCKDIAGNYNERISIAAYLEREDVRDSIIGAASISSLKHGAKIGCSSPRRKSQLLNLRPDLEILDIRGNVETRIKKVESGDFDATILAVAGLKRLRLNEYINPVSIDDMLPQAGQAAIAITTRLGEESLVRNINHLPTYVKVTSERAAIKEYGGDCYSSIAVNAELNGENILLRGYVDGQSFEIKGEAQNANELGKLMGEKLKRHSEHSEESRSFAYAQDDGDSK